MQCGKQHTKETSGSLYPLNRSLSGRYGKVKIIDPTSRKVAGSRYDEENKLFSIYIILPAALGSGFYLTSNRNEYQKQRNKVSGE
jgi:hypothetical protein